MKFRLWLLLLVLPAMLLLVVAATSTRRGFKSGVYAPAHAAPEFALAGSDGSVQSLKVHRGRVVALAFGFTHCQRICPVTLAKLADVENRLGDSAKDFDVVFVTVDPERDKPARMREFLDFFNPTFVGGTGDPAVLKALHRAYGVTVDRVVSDDAKLRYDVHHSTSIYLIDRNGALRLLAPFATTADDLLHDVRMLLET